MISSDELKFTTRNRSNKFTRRFSDEMRCNIFNFLKRNNRTVRKDLNLVVPHNKDEEVKKYFVKDTTVCTSKRTDYEETTQLLPLEFFNDENEEQMDETQNDSWKFIVCKSATELLNELKVGNLSSREVTEAFIEAARQAHKRTHCVKNFRFKEALEEADLADEKFRRREELGMLHGLPLSVMESINYDKIASPYASGCRKKVDNDAEIISLVRKEGAIPFVHTTSHNSMVKRPNEAHSEPTTLCNPYNKKRTCGGSSSGEAALMRLLGSPLGVGIDVGGEDDTRTSASFCGLVGFKPTPLPNSMDQSALCKASRRASSSKIPIVISPLAGSVDDVALFVHAYKPLTSIADKSRTLGDISSSLTLSTDAPTIRIGYYESMDCFPTSSACQRAVREAITKLKHCSRFQIELIPFVPPDASRFMWAYKNLSMHRESNAIREEDEDDVVYPITDSKKESDSSNSLHTIKSRMNRLIKQSRKISISSVYGCGSTNVFDYQTCVTVMDHYRETFHKRVNDMKLDAIISPNNALPALPHGTSQDIAICSCIYSSIFSYFGYPSGVVPWTRVREYEQCYESKIQENNSSFSRKAKYIMIDSVSLPISIQVSALPNRDKKCLQVMKLLESMSTFDRFEL